MNLALSRICKGCGRTFKALVRHRQPWPELCEHCTEEASDG